MKDKWEPDFDRDIANFKEEQNARQIEALRLLDSGQVKFLLYGDALGLNKPQPTDNGKRYAYLPLPRGANVEEWQAFSLKLEKLTIRQPYEYPE